MGKMKEFWGAIDCRCVQILVRVPGQWRGNGSGFVVFSDKTHTLVMTCGLVLGGFFRFNPNRPRCFVRFQGPQDVLIPAANATSIAAYASDVGLLCLEDPVDRPSFSFAQNFTDGMSLFMGSFPFGHREIAHTSGPMSRRALPASSILKFDTGVVFVEYCVPASAGSSGAPVINSDGGVVAIHTMARGCFSYGVSTPSVINSLLTMYRDFNAHESRNITLLLQGILRRFLARGLERLFHPISLQPLTTASSSPELHSCIFESKMYKMVKVMALDNSVAHGGILRLISKKISGGLPLQDRVTSLVGGHAARGFAFPVARDSGNIGLMSRITEGVGLPYSADMRKSALSLNEKNFAQEFGFAAVVLMPWFPAMPLYVTVHSEHENRNARRPRTDTKASVPGSISAERNCCYFILSSCAAEQLKDYIWRISNTSKRSNHASNFVR